MKGKNRNSRSSEGALGGNGRSNGHGHSRTNGNGNGHGDRNRGQRPNGARPTEISGKRMWLYGIHPVLAALANPRRRALRCSLTIERT